MLETMVQAMCLPITGAFASPAVVAHAPFQEAFPSLVPSSGCPLVHSVMLAAFVSARKFLVVFCLSKDSLLPGALSFSFEFEIYILDILMGKITYRRGQS